MTLTDLTGQTDLALLVVATLGGVCVLCAGLLWLTARQGRRLAGRLAAVEADFERLRAECAVVAGHGAKVAERLRRLEQLSGQLGDRLGQLELRGEGRPFDQAIALAGQGGDADRLVSHFGLSRGEADLVSLLHGRRKTA
jgi:hypothetical protein